MKTSEVLYRAADVIRERGWTQGIYQDDHGNVCMVGAMGIANHNDARKLFPRRVWERLMNPLLEVCGTIGPIAFNDRYCETADDAIAALEIAADLAAANRD